jgi:hypothetical protein
MSDAAGGYSKIGRDFADHHSVVHSKKESPGVTMTLKKSFKGLNPVVPAGEEIQSLGHGRLLWLGGLKRRRLSRRGHDGSPSR